MFEEDALARMEELGHQFFVYVDAETERVNVLYKRSDGDFGLIEPIVGSEYTAGQGRPGTRSDGRHRPATQASLRGLDRDRLRPSIDPALAAHQPPIDQIAAERGHVGMEEREAHVD